MNFAAETIAPASSPFVPPPEEILAAGLPDLLDRFPGIDHLSLDCFDTIVWRHADSPRDVFYAAARRPAFVAHGMTAYDREVAEAAAKEQQWIRGRGEVALEDIYRAFRPELTDAEIDALAADELAAEMLLCFAHPAAVGLLRRASNAGIRVSVVSDMYLGEARLRRLLEHLLPSDAMSAIERVVCSSDHGVSKSEGLFELVYPKDAQRRRAILHVGDNPIADRDAARKAGMQAVLLIQDGDEENERRRMRGTALALLDPAVRAKKPLMAPYRGALSWLARSGAARPDLGGVSFGLCLHAFGRWLREERRQLLERHERVKFLFLLRDGHLPFLAHQAVDAAPDCHPVRISRFTSYAASFRGLREIDAYLARFGSTRRFDVMARQLLLPRKLIRQIVARSNAAADPLKEFCEIVRSPSMVETTVSASERFRRRMRRYLEREAGMQPGDTVVFVDLGYLGTAQRVLRPVFEEEWGNRLLGRYLIYFGGPAEDRYRGMIDDSWCDRRAVGALFEYAPLPDKLCTGPGGSVEDYTESGMPVLAVDSTPAAQRDRVAILQERCIEFIRDVEMFFSQCTHPVSLDWLKEAALAELGRLVFFPTREEIAEIGAFEDASNLGASTVFRMLDFEAGLTGLRTRGFNYMEQKEARRLLYPAELRVAGFELSLTLLASHRFGLEIPAMGWSYRTEEFDFLIVDGSGSLRKTARAHSTHDGYFACVLPLGSGAYSLGLLLGQAYRWLQVHSIDIVPIDELMSHSESTYRRDVRSNVILDGIREHAGGLWECHGEASLVMIPPGIHTGSRHAACRFVFRPVVRC